VNGLLVPPGDVGALRAALARLFQERGLAERLGQGARATAERFAWERVRPALEEVLERWRAR
jgi:glycosyltransferase involved in cell wall biosynthesis